MSSSLHVVETAYRLDVNDDEWLQALCDTTAAMVPNHGGVLAMQYRDLEGQLVPVRSTQNNVSETVLQVIGAFSTQSQTVRPILLPGFICEYGRRVQGEDFEEMFGATLERAGIWDTLGIKTVDDEGNGLFVGIVEAERPAQPRVRQRHWSKIGAHIVSGFRLRKALASASSALEDADAIFETDGSPAHVESHAEPVLSALRDSVSRIQRTRSSGDVSDGKRLNLWKGLTEGKWSLVDSFDSDGRRYVVAVRNDPRWPDPRRLPPEERNVALAAANGHTNKMIGYQFGLSESTVSTRLSAAMQKLGCSSRVELIRLVRMLMEPSDRPKAASG